MRPGGSLVFMGGTGGRRVSRDIGIVSAATARLPPFIATLALELAPIRVNLIAAGFRRHATVGVAARRQAGGAAERTAGQATDRPCGDRRGRRRAGRPPDDQYRSHRRDLRHRRWSAVRCLRRRRGRFRTIGETCAVVLIPWQSSKLMHAPDPVRAGCRRSAAVLRQPALRRASSVSIRPAR